MSDTYTQIHIQVIFAVKGRQSLIPFSFEDELYKYITGIVQNKNQKMLAINGMPDHIHIFIGYDPKQKIPDLVETIKTDSNHFIKRSGFSKFAFSWQAGYGAFSYSRSQVKVVAEYIMNQEEHHRNKTFREEYLEMLQKFEIEFKEEYLFDFIDVHEWE